MPKDPVVSASKHLSLVLRHDPGSVGLTLDPQGWVAVSDLLAAMRLDRAMLDRVVAENNKKRFEFSEDGLRIRARQGHSVEVDLGYEPAEPPAILYHGTGAATFPAIRKQGLLKMSRHAVHLSADEATARNVGSRHGKPVVMVVYAGTMHLYGAKFYVTPNGVWLTDHVPPGYIVWPCSDCLQEVERGYIVHDDLWLSVAEKEEVLHVECLEKRIGRKLVPADFAPGVPLNQLNGFLPGGSP